MVKLFAVSAPGLRSITAQELAGMGMVITETGPQAESEGQTGPGEEAGGVAFEGGQADIYRANLHLRTASRVLVRLGEFYAAAFAELRKKAARLEWERYLAPGSPVALRVTAHKSRLYHSGAVAERVAGAIADRMGKPSPVQGFDENAPGPLPQLVVVRLVRDLCTISIDSSGEGLHRRGYRKATAKAPLRETLAAAMLLAVGYDGASPLLDPFCGSGTIPIEAALLGTRTAPGGKRSFAFMRWPGFDQHAWQALLEQSAAQAASCSAPITGSDRDAGAIQIAQSNAARAGVEGCIEFIQQAVSAVQPQGVGCVVTNPPYGLRVSQGKDLRNLYARFGSVLRAQCPGWRVAVLSSQDLLLRSTGLPFEQVISTVNGGVSVKLALGVVPTE